MPRGACPGEARMRGIVEPASDFKVLEIGFEGVCAVSFRHRISAKGIALDRRDVTHGASPYEMCSSLRGVNFIERLSHPGLRPGL